MKRTLSEHDFVDAFYKTRSNGMYEQLGGREGLSMLFDYFQMGSLSSDEYALDDIGNNYVCSTVENILIDYGREIEIPPGSDYDTPRDRILEVYDAIQGFLENHTIVVGVLDDGRILYRQF